MVPAARQYIRSPHQKRRGKEFCAHALTRRPLFAGREHTAAALRALAGSGRAVSTAESATCARHWSGAWFPDYQSVSAYRRAQAARCRELGDLIGGTAPPEPQDAPT